MDAPLRTKLLIAFVAVALVGGLLTTVASTVLINRLVVGEAQRRVALGLKTAHSVLSAESKSGARVTGVLASWAAQGEDGATGGLSQKFLEKLRVDNRLNLLQVLDNQGKVVLTARGQALGRVISDSPLVRAALSQGQPVAGLRLVPLEQLTWESPELAQQAHLEMRETAAAKPGASEPLTEAMMVETAAPILDATGRVLGVVRSGTVLNQDYPLVDLIREDIFTTSMYRGRNLGTVTIFQRDVRIATNVTDEQGRRAVGTRVSAEVYDRVLGQGEIWIGPALVVDNWYISAYEPLRDFDNGIIGILYVGVLQQRYEDMRSHALLLILGISALALALAVVMAIWLAGRLSRPLTRLTEAAGAIAQGDLDYRLTEPRSAMRDETKTLMVSFNRMVEALRERDEQLRRSYDRLQTTTQELHRWNQNYLETLEFITHELKNQVAAMKLNVLAIRDGYVGDISPEQREALEDVASTLRRTEEMILNYLNLSRIEKGELEIRSRPVQVERDVLEPVLRELHSRLTDDEITVQVDLPEDVVVQADPSLLQVVLANLVGNAAKYGKRGGKIRVFGERAQDRIEIHVWNDGPGIRPEEREHLFRRFSRLSSGEIKERGTGLGLFIAREITRRHGGELRVESDYPQWIDFVVTLPRADLVGELPQDTIG
ncbi:MAG TPA: cache domain-containing protein [Armatimonadota bacterium]|jgi:two-component system NtrC family sensor kinase